jgi:hypothetical protein
MNTTMDSIVICADNTSNRVITYENDTNGMLIMLTNADGSFGMSNIHAYLSDMLQRLNGQNINVSVDDKGITIAHDPEEKLFGVYYTRCNCCKISEDTVKSVCKIGTSDCCIFTSVGSDGFECLKFDSSTARMLLDRFSKKEMNASRIGNCAILGRNESI